MILHIVTMSICTFSAMYGICRKSVHSRRSPDGLGSSRGTDRGSSAYRPFHAVNAGAVLYDGSATINFGDGLFAVPVSALWRAG